MIPEERFWKEKGNNHLGKLKGNAFGEGFDVLGILKGMLGQYDTVLEIGCGEGRLCDAFRPDQYLGIDVCDTSIDIAQQKHPNHQFASCEYHDVYPTADAILLYTVLMHVSDDEIEEIIGNVVNATGVVLVSEMLGREWGMSRFKGQALPAYNRDLDDYQGIFEDVGFHITDHKQFLVERYKAYESTRNVRTSFIKFEKANAQ